ncbi:MAG: hypothetical protein K8E66_09640, partial [Phycisphaerales bacterium]|nr:hypothetical protein [Phycisphaerales bacterium]
MRLRIHDVFLAVILAAHGPLSAGTYTWDGEGQSNNWSEATNWVGDAVPPDFSDIVLPKGSLVVVDGDAEVSALDCRGFIQINPGGTLVLADPSTMYLGTVNGGVIENNALLTVTNKLTQRAGDIRGSGSIEAPAGSVFMTADNAPKSLAQSLSCDGTIDLRADLNLNAQDPGDSVVIDVGASALVLMEGDLTKTGAGSVTLNNHGTITASGLLYPAISAGIFVENHPGASVHVVQNSGLSMFGRCRMAGQISIDQGAFCELGGEADLLGGLVCQGIGAIALAGMIDVQGPVTIDCRALVNGELGGSADITFNSTMNWFNGVMLGEGRALIGPGGHALLGGNNLDLRRTIEAEGDFEWFSGNLQLRATPEGVGRIVASGPFTADSNGAMSGDTSGVPDVVVTGLIT